MTGLAPTPSGRGYWLVAGDGGVFTFGDAPFLGSTGGTAHHRAVVGLGAPPRGLGYWLVTADGGMSAYGEAPLLGGTGGQPLAAPVVGMAARPLRSEPEVAVFLYPWYGRPERDGFWWHWGRYASDWGERVLILGG